MYGFDFKVFFMRMKGKRNLIIIIISLLCIPTFADNNPHIISDSDSASYFKPDKKPWRAAAIGTGINLGIFGFNRFVTKEDFAYVNFKTIKRNLRTWPVWDSDKLSTNLIGHPYHGSLYYNAARANGYSFYGSLPFTLGGSLMWEFTMENEPPSRNDLISTTFGGVALGEITFRLSDLILDNRTSGSNRFFREFFAGLLAPTRAINRLVTGDAWQYSSNRGNQVQRLPIKGSFLIGGRNVTDHDRTQKYGVSVKAGVEYGDIFDYEISNPYEWFQTKIQLDYLASRFSLTQVNVIGALYTKELYNKNNLQVFGGFFQHFNYFNSKVTKKNQKEFRPYYISEAASLGGGVLVEKEINKFRIEGKYFANGIALGASISDHFKIDNRDYNMGSGFSLKLHTDLTYNNKLRFKLRGENYNIYTWKGYDEDLDFKDLTDHEISFLNTQGDRSVARLYLVGMTAEYDISDNVYLGVERFRYIRKTTYKSMPRVSYTAWDDFIHLGFKF